MASSPDVLQAKARYLQNVIWTTYVIVFFYFKLNSFVSFVYLFYWQLDFLMDCITYVFMPWEIILEKKIAEVYRERRDLYIYI